WRRLGDHAQCPGRHPDHFPRAPVHRRRLEAAGEKEEVTGWSLRPGRAADAATLVAIERRACELLRGHEAYPVFARSTLAADDHVEAAARGRLWVAESDGRAVG